MKVCRKSVRQNIKFIIFLVVLFAVGNRISTLIININSNEPAVEESNEGIKGLGLFISDKSNNIHNTVIDYNRMNDYGYTFMNQTGADLDCCLNIFIDGKQIPILNTDSNGADSNYKFFIADNESKSVPIGIVLENLQDGAHIVNFSVVSDYNEYAVNNEADVWITSTYNYTVAIEKNNKILNIPQLSNTLLPEENICNEEELSQFIANCDKEDFIGNQKPDNCITSKPNEIIEVPLVVGGSDTSNTLIYATLDNKQIKINNSDSVLYQLPKDNVSSINIKLYSPSKSGKYELLFYSLDNFINKDIEGYAELKFSASH